MSMPHFIRRCGDTCSIVKLHPDGSEEILESGLSVAEAETLYFICIGEPVWEERSASAGEQTARQRRSPGQLEFEF
jgi:hypothetical protein